MKILILSDSLTLPREKPEVCRFEQTWPELLRKEGHAVHQVSIGGATSADLYRQCPYHASFRPDAIILQVGIVDSAPRFLTKTEKKFLSKIPFAGNRLIKAMNKNWIRKLRNLKYISPAQFAKNIDGIARYFPESKRLSVGIIPPVSAYETQLPGVTENVRSYNAVLAKAPVQFISLERLPEDGVMSDHHHLNALGHEYIFRQINELLINGV